MFKVTVEDDKENELTMAELKPCQLAIVVEYESDYIGDIVMRTASVDKFEVMILSDAKRGHCWTVQCNIKVKLLPKGTKLTLEVV